ncbi:hypothetical protein [Lentzea indica]|nr:hypothetical protein [Lentzea indica]
MSLLDAQLVAVKPQLVERGPVMGTAGPIRLRSGHVQPAAAPDNVT